MNRDRRKRIADLVEKLSGIMIELDEAIETANDEKLSGIMIELDEAMILIVTISKVSRLASKTRRAGSPKRSRLSDRSNRKEAGVDEAARFMDQGEEGGGSAEEPRTAISKSSPKGG